MQCWKQLHRVQVKDLLYSTSQLTVVRLLAKESGKRVVLELLLKLKKIKIVR